MAQSGPAQADCCLARPPSNAMARSFREIAGGSAPRRRRPSRRERDIWAPLTSPNLDLTPRALRLERSKPNRFRPKRRFDVGLAVIVASGVGVVAWIGWQFWSATRVDVEMAGFESGTPYTPENAEKLAVSITMPKEDDRFRAELTVDGVELLAEELLEFDGDTVTVSPADLVDGELVESALDEGEHTIALTVSRLFIGDARFEWTYAVDSVAPVLSVPSALDPVAIDAEVTLAGEVEPDAELFFNGEPLEHDDGRFEIDFDHPPSGALAFEAVDRAGNRSAAQSVVPVAYPSSSRAVHVSAAAWGNEELREGVLSLIERGLIDTVELDLKDEDGVIGYESEIELAQEIGAVKPEYDLAEAVETLDGLGVRVIGRLVAFRDPVYAAAAWAAGREDEVLQTPDGEMLSAYGGFTNYMHDSVRDYNLSIALEAVDLGVRDILWDYIRRPEGHPSTMFVPGLGNGSSSEAVVDFLETTHEELRVRGAYQGASVFGIAAASGSSIAQDVPSMARVVDYLAPMIYPSHWGEGQYRVPSPIRDPYEITRRSLQHFQEVAGGSGVRFLPWIQDFTIFGVVYGPAEVRAQIEAAKSLGIEGFLLWNPNVRYTADALDPLPRG